MKKILVGMLLFPLMSWAGVQSDLGGFFDALGYEGNVSQSHSWEAQEAGYYSGGSAYLRNQVKNVQLISLDMPSFKGGCGGIDAYLGGFSFVQGDALSNLANSIINAGESYAFDLALETTVPEIKHVKDYLESLEQKASSMVINSCETAEDLVGGVWPKARESQQQICQDVGTHTGLFSDYAKARQECAGSGFDTAMEKANQDPQYKDSVIVNKNLVWEALKKQTFLASDKELSELVMSLTGSIIFNGDGKAQEVPSLIDSESLTKTLMHGGDSTLWSCDNQDTCLHVSEDSVHVDDAEALVGQVSNMLIEIIDAVQLDEPLTDKEKGFVNSTQVPILKFITVLASSRSGVSPTDVLPYAELIAEDLLEQYLSELLRSEKTSLSSTSYPPDLQTALSLKIQEAQKVIAQMSVNTNQKVQNNMELLSNMQAIEKTVAADVGANFKQDLSQGDE
jgi:conjugative transfer pilus assembly protein TraH